MVSDTWWNYDVNIPVRQTCSVTDIRGGITERRRL